MIDRRRLWYLKNKNKVNASHRIRQKERYHNDEAYRLKKIESSKASYNKYRSKRIIYKRKYYKENKLNNVQFKLKCVVRHRINNALILTKCERLYPYKTLIGCSYEYLQKYLEAKFKPGMTWKNHGFNGWHIDHIDEICSYDLHKGADQKKVFNYKNLQPLWARENWKKRSLYISKIERQIKKYKKQNIEYRKAIRELINKA